jgi:antitoxin component of RelBE/YafQ-DinJ toxin-antitoxin module
MRLAAFLLAFACILAAHAQTVEEGKPPSSASRVFTPRIVQKTGLPLDIGEIKAFTEQALRNGVRATREQCERLGNGIWASTDQGDSACLRYWAAGLGTGLPARRAVAYFPGDAWASGRAVPGYEAVDDDALAKAAATWAGRLGLPYVFIARPGTYGSSGDHMERRRPAESRLVSAALDELKTRLGITEYVVVGFSGGGHVTSALVTLRSDIVCAVPGGAPSSPRMRWELKRWTTDATGYGDSYEPTEHLRKEAVHPALRIFVVGDPRDREGVWPAQTVLAQVAREKGIPAEVIEVKGKAPDFHGGQGEIVRLVAGWCGNDIPTAEIVRRAWGYKEE